MAISISTIRTDVYTTIYNHIQTGTYAITTNNIHPSYNRLQSIQESYPQVIITEPIVSFDKLTMGTKGLYEVPVVVNIDVYEDSSADAKTVADEVSNKILSGRSVLRDAGLKNIKFESDKVDVQPYSQVKTLHTYTISFGATYVGVI